MKPGGPAKKAGLDLPEIPKFKGPAGRGAGPPGPGIGGLAGLGRGRGRGGLGGPSLGGLSKLGGLGATPKPAEAPAPEEKKEEVK